MESVDVRGSQKGIFRLYGFDRLSLLHMIFYRVLIFVSIATAVVGLYYIGFVNPAELAYLKPLILAVWILFTPQLFSVAKVLSLSASNGIVFSKLDQSFLRTVQQKPAYFLLAVLPYVVLLGWVLFFVALTALWYL